MFSKELRRNKIRARIRSRITGTAQKPRLSVFRSNKYIYAQLIDDVTGVTLVSTSSRALTEKVNKVGGIEFKTGTLISSVINVLVSLLFLYYLFKITRVKTFF
jgi:ribosomal protein L18